MLGGDGMSRGVVGNAVVLIGGGGTNVSMGGSRGGKYRRGGWRGDI